MADLNPFAAFAQGRQLQLQKRADERIEEDRARAAAGRNRMAEMLAGGHAGDTRGTADFHCRDGKG